MMHRMNSTVLTKTLRHVCLLLPACIAMIASTGAAQIAGIQEAMKPEFFTRDLIVFIEGLDLDDTQQIIVEALFDDYEHSFELGFARMETEFNEQAIDIKSRKEELEKMANSEQELLSVVLAPIEQWMKERDELGDQLIENVRVILLPEQEVLWVAFTRNLYIEKKLPQGLLNGESTNVFHVLRDMSLDSRATAHIEPQVSAYANEIHAALRRRSMQIQGPHMTILETMNAADSPQETERKLDVITARVHVRTTNDMGIQAIAEALGQEQGEAFWYEAMKRGYPRIFRRTPAQRTLEDAASQTIYAEDIQLAIAQLLADYLNELTVMNGQLMTATQLHDPDKQRNSIENRMRKKNGEAIVKIEDSTKAILADRKQLGIRYIEQLRALLTTEQFDEIEGARRFAPPKQTAAPTRPGHESAIQLNNVNMNRGGKKNGPNGSPTGIGGAQPRPKGQGSDRD
jgi:hypothetical protein